MHFHHIHTCGSGKTTVDLRLNEDEKTFTIDLLVSWMGGKDISKTISGKFEHKESSNYYFLTLIDEAILGEHPWAYLQLVLLHDKQTLHEGDNDYSIILRNNAEFNDNFDFDSILIGKESAYLKYGSPREEDHVIMKYLDHVKLVKQG